MKLWSVTLEAETVVLAETAEDACIEARQSMSDMGSSSFETRADELTSLPWGWEEDCVPYGEANRSIKELIAAGHGQSYVEARAVTAARAKGAEEYLKRHAEWVAECDAHQKGGSEP